jgi:hypothetical protein
LSEFVDKWVGLLDPSRRFHIEFAMTCRLEGPVTAQLPKTSTGKIQKFVMRDVAKSASAIQ